MKIIFLDIDGVLNCELWYKQRFEILDRLDVTGNYPFYEFAPFLIERLNKIIEATHAKVVISSTWRIGRTVQELQDLLTAVGFKGEVIDTTPHFYANGHHDDKQINYTVPRGCEIDWWLSNKGNYQRINWSRKIAEDYLQKAIVKNYIILDDDSDMLYSQKEHFVKTDVYHGLTEEHVKQAITILNSSPINLYYN
jgi:hypothetical protein